MGMNMVHYSNYISLLGNAIFQNDWFSFKLVTTYFRIFVIKCYSFFGNFLLIYRLDRQRDNWEKKVTISAVSLPDTHNSSSCVLHTSLPCRSQALSA